MHLFNYSSTHFFAVKADEPFSHSAAVTSHHRVLNLPLRIFIDGVITAIFCSPIYTSLLMIFATLASSDAKDPLAGDSEEGVAMIPLAVLGGEIDAHCGDMTWQ
jgi:hypothetical protein